MTQLQFIPLKTPEGRLCGHARVAGGFVELQLRADAPGRAAVLTAAGVTEGPVGSRIAVQGAPVQAVAVHEAGRIRCLGLARGVSLTPEQVRARLMTPRRAGAEGAARMETDAARALARAAAQGEAARAAEPAAPAMAEGKGDAPAVMAQGEAAQAAEPALADGAARPAERAREKGAAPDAQAPAMAEGKGDVPAAPAMADETREAQAAEPAQADGAARPAERAREKGAAPDAQAPAMAEGKGDAPAVMAETSDRPSAPASIEQSAADSESFMALLRRADAAFQRLSRRVEPMPGADMLPGAPPEPPRRSGRTEDGVRAAAAIAQDTAAPADGAAAEPSEAPRTSPAAPADGAAAEPPEAPRMAPAAPADGAAAEPPEAPRMPPAAPAGDGPRRARRLPGELSGWSDEVDRLLEDRAPLPRRDPVANPFPNIFPGAVFERVTLPGGAAHLAGEWQRGGERMQITAVPGAYSPRPPAHLPDFTRYIRARSGGYWIRVRPAPRA